MITNERQLKISKAQLRKFKKHLEKIQTVRKEENSELLKLEEEALQNQIEKLETQINEYEQIWNSKTPIPKLLSINDIPKALIRARLSQGMSQKDFADKIGLKEQQIQRYEASEYESASLIRIKEFANFFNIKLQDETEIPLSKITFQDFIKKIKKAGFDNSFINTKLLPPKLSEDPPVSLNSFSIQVIEQIGKIFGWSLNQIINNKQLSINTSILGNIKFKAPKKASHKRKLVYTFYSNYLSQIIYKATDHLKQIELQDNPYKIREEILNKYGSINIENSLCFFWDAGIPVLSINEPGGFHGLFIRKKGRSLLIINHRTKSPALWLFSLFHELRHIILHQKDMEDKIIEIEDLQNLTLEDESFNEEIEASLFAGAVLLGKAPDPLVHMCLEEANYTLPYLKQAVINVAKKEGVQEDVLANLVAFKVAQEGKDFWGSAHNLQKTEKNIQKIARDVLLKYIDFSRISSLDLDLLRRALISNNTKK